MDKSSIESFVTELKNKGITKFLVRCEGGNRILYNNDNSLIRLKDDALYCVERSKNYAAGDGIIDIIKVAYEDINDIKSVDLSYTDSIELCKSLGLWDADMEEMFTSIGHRSDLQIGTAGLDTKKDKDGKVILPSGVAGILTK